MNATSFFGYFDKSPFNTDGTRLLAHRMSFDGRSLTSDDIAEIGFYNISCGKWNSLGKTRAINWQQGAMLQWLGPDFNSRVIYNDRRNGEFVSVLLDVCSRESTILPHPIYSVHPSGRSALGVVFERHYFCRAYHYEGISATDWDRPIHPLDGIRHIDLDTGKSKLIVRTEDISAINPYAESTSANNWLEHVTWNPSGTRFAFMHRSGQGEEFSSRLFTANPDGSEVFHFSHCEQSTHLAWRTNNEFTVWARKSSPLRRTYEQNVRRRPYWFTPVAGAYRFAKKHFLPSATIRRIQGGSYLSCHDSSSLVEIIGQGKLTEDGHPSWTQNGRYMLTDTYPDAESYRHLLLYDRDKKILHHVGKFHSINNNTGYRCDLHPRLSRDDKYAIIDSSHWGCRQIVVLELNWEVINSCAA